MDGQTTFHFNPHIGIQVKQTNCHPSYWNPCETRDGQTTLHFKQHIMRHVTLQLKSTQDRQTDKLRFMSLLILESKLDRRTNYVFFHPSYWNLSKTDELFYSSSLILESTPDKQSTFHFSPHVVLDRQANYVSLNCHIIIQDRQTKYVNFILHIGMHIRQTDFIYSTPHIGIKASQTGGQTTSFISSCHLNIRKTDGQSTFHFTPQIGIYARQTDGQSTFHFIHQMWIQDKLPSYWNLCKINEQTFHFTTHIGI